MSLALAIEKADAIWDEWLPLARMQWDETEAYHEGQSFNPDRKTYAHYEANGWFIMATARDGGRLVGYAGFYVTPSAHSGALTATEDTWFLHHDWRRGMNAIRLFRFAEEYARDKGAIEASGSIKSGHPAAAAVLTYLGYVETARVFTKQLRPRAAMKEAS